MRVIIYRRQGAFPGTPPQSTVVKASIEHNYLGLQIFLTKGGAKSGFSDKGVPVTQ